MFDGHVDRMIRMIVWMICCMSLSASAIGAQTDESAASTRTVRLLAIGNSFSGNSTKYLHDLVRGSGHQLIFGHASIGGCPMKKHYDLAMLHESSSDDPNGKPYRIAVKGQSNSVSLKELLLQQPWEYVTIQQFSMHSFDINTYRPYAQQLVDYVHRYAPQAKIVIHETWAYRQDDPLFRQPKPFTHWQMYEQLHQAYATIGKEIGAAGILPVGTAYQNLLQDSRWEMELASPDELASVKHPELPRQKGSLHVGYYWDTKGESPTLRYDGHHAGVLGEYLGAAVWHEFFFGDVRGNPYLAPNMNREQAVILQEIAHRTVTQGLQPAAPPKAHSAKTDCPNPSLQGYTGPLVCDAMFGLFLQGPFPWPRLPGKSCSPTPAGWTRPSSCPGSRAGIRA